MGSTERCACLVNDELCERCPHAVCGSDQIHPGFKVCEVQVRGLLHPKRLNHVMYTFPLEVKDGDAGLRCIPITHHREHAVAWVWVHVERRTLELGNSGAATDEATC